MCVCVCVCVCVYLIRPVSAISTISIYEDDHCAESPSSLNTQKHHRTFIEYNVE